MKKYINYIVIVFICFFSFIDVKAQYKIENDWSDKYSGRIITIGKHSCGSFFDKVPLALTMCYEGVPEIYRVSCNLPLYAPKEFPPKVLILLKSENGKIIELLGKHYRGATQKEKVTCEGKPYFRYVAVITLEITEEKLKELILANIVKIRFQTETTPIDKEFNKNEFSYVLENSYMSIQRRLHPEWFRDEVREGF